jgi:hypothetical protein
MKNIIIALTLLFATSAFADQKIYENHHWGLGFEKGTGYEAYGIKFLTKDLFVKEFKSAEVHHSLLASYDLLTVKNLGLDSSGHFEKEFAHLFTLGMRVTTNMNPMYTDFALRYLNPEGGLSKDSSTGFMVKVGYLLAFEKVREQSKTAYFDVAVSYTGFLDEAKNVAARPDLFNGLAFSLSWLY